MTLILDISRWYRAVEVGTVMDHSDPDNPRELGVGAAQTCKPGCIRLYDDNVAGWEIHIPLTTFRRDLYMGKYVILVRDMEDFPIDDLETEEIANGFDNLRMDDRPWNAEK